jgi:hypothetical protein
VRRAERWGRAPETTGGGLVFVVRRLDGTPITAVPVEGDDWNEAVLWAWLAARGDAARHAMRQTNGTRPPERGQEGTR